MKTWCANGRLRDARRAITSQLGPFPAASAVVVTLFGAVSKDMHGSQSTLLFGLVLAAFVAMVLLSTIAVFPRPYRKLRKEALQKLPTEAVASTKSQRLNGYQA
jgi:hypothetical protein